MKKNLSKPFPIPLLHTWFLANKREFPWRENPEPYAVWVSEVMLQQTQAAVVIGYFNRWMERFPSIHDLAKASLEEVIKLWEGLGYYSRARHLHQAAQYIVENFQGVLPDQATELKKIKGLGPYTIGAILSFAFHQKVAAVDGNVLRVLARYFCRQEDISLPKTVALFREIATELLPKEEHWITNEALIELGATVCKKVPNCQACPIRGSCEGYIQGKSHALPYKSTKVTIQKLQRAVPLILCEQAVLLKKGEQGKIMSDLYEFPFFEMTEILSIEQIRDLVFEKFGLKIYHQETLETVKHSFTRYQATLFPEVFKIKQKKEIEGFIWIDLEILPSLPFSAGHRQIYKGYFKRENEELYEMV